MRARVGKKLDAACAQVFALLALVFYLAAHIAQKPGQHGQVQLVVRRRRGVEPPLVFGHHGVELAVDVFPLAQAADVDEVLAQQLLVLAVAEFVNAWCRRGAEIGVRARVSLCEIGIRPQFPLRCQTGLRAAVFFATRIRNPLPQLQVTAELAALVVKLGVRLVGLGLHVHGTVAHVLHAQGRGDDQHLVERLAAARLQNHAAYARV